MTEEEFIKRFNEGDEFSESELRELNWALEIIDNIYGENQRWRRPVKTIFEVQGRLFALEWEEGLTESQLSYFDKQPYEVERVAVEKVVTVVEYPRKKTED